MPIFSMSVYVLIAVVVFLLLLLVIRIKRRMRAKTRQHYPENEQLYVGNLPYQINAHQLKHIFSQFGELGNVRLIKNMRTGRSKGFAFVTFVNLKDAKKALSMNGKDVHGRPAVVRMAKPREE